MTWTPLWRQAHTAGLPLKLFAGKNHNKKETCRPKRVSRLLSL